MKAILKYTDCLHDGKRVSSVLYENNIQILRIRPGKSIYPQVTIHVNDYDELNMLIQKLNDACLYGVEVVKVNTINYSVIVIEYLLLFLLLLLCQSVRVSLSVWTVEGRRVRCSPYIRQHIVSDSPPHNFFKLTTNIDLNSTMT